MHTTPDTNPGDDIADGRDESPVQRADRNWSELLQELRVLQTGTQILTGFLLALAFQSAFTELSPGQRAFYLVLLVLAALSAIIALAPVALHRLLFRHHVKVTIVGYGHAAVITALATVALLLIGVVAFVFDVVVDASASITVAVTMTALLFALWLIGPAVIRARLHRDANGRGGTTGVEHDDRGGGAR